MIAEFLKWQDEQRLNPKEKPTNVDLDTITGLHEWLSHSSNWKKTDLYVVGWFGTDETDFSSAPWISESHAWKLAPGSDHGAGLLQAILFMRRRRKSPVSVSEET